ncbi:hypothetical protein CRM91_12250 [Burkholderia ambifaria]|nr:hypothetical protein CRM91_12250 [Burkholderia ambifaria]
MSAFHIASIRPVIQTILDVWSATGDLELRFADGVERASPESHMKRATPFAILIALAAASMPALAGSTASPVPQQAKNCVPSSTSAGTAPGSRATSKAPPIRVCVGDSDTQLNLPWFLTDVLTAVDTHQSPRDLFHKMRNDF